MPAVVLSIRHCIAATNTTTTATTIKKSSPSAAAAAAVTIAAAAAAAAAATAAAAAATVTAGNNSTTTTTTTLYWLPVLDSPACFYCGGRLFVVGGATASTTISTGNNTGIGSSSNSSCSSSVNNCFDACSLPPRNFGRVCRCDGAVVLLVPYVLGPPCFRPFVLPPAFVAASNHLRYHRRIHHLLYNTAVINMETRLKGTGGSALGAASSALVGTSGNLGAAAAAAVLSGGSSRVTSSGVELRELRRHNYKASVSVLSHINKGITALPYTNIGPGHRQRTRAHRAMNMGQKISSGVKTVSRESAQPYKPVVPRELAQDFARPARLDILLDMPPASKEVQIKHAWNADDRSLNIFVKDEDKLTFHRHPVAQSTDCIRGKTGLTKGLHVWEVNWSTRQRGTHAVVGVATVAAPLHSVGYQSLVGNNDQSWGWDLGRNKLYHDAKSYDGITYPALLKPDETFIVPDKFLVVLDMDEGTLSFVVDGQYLGVAFRGLKGHELFPIVSAVWGHCEITMKYIGGLDPEPLPLMDLCRRVIRQQIGKQYLEERVMDLNLPQSLSVYLLYRDRR
ncbi:Concanavalin A-like lectin/glucanase domain,SPRY domain,SOCS box domain,B30.2/SPRY domain [Cinara cedri]|uniref:Concanavalin A-like lectin/glucanase domain,SPRY domain,SOCS box domain,B30.2/SPRY domain n=1 Tax=Cinara cedri TaxID=506608 RepID=A0A5E4MZG7_9HEMI|nr:Concanavalin A-like lectin/glucanase domain,SPRY domain,SOCS box domain,B30.2/SPRY domain [Cinara cedri]